jgi:hypothetical protein
MKKLAVIVMMLLPLYASAQQLDNFSLTNVVDNKAVSLDTYPSCEGMVIVFTSNTCPYDEYYRNRLAKLAVAYHDKVPVILVNSGTDAAESAEKMGEKARQLSLSMPYLADKDQVLMTKLEAKKTPEAVLLKNVNGKFSVVYRGAIDDNAQVEADVRQNYLRDAIDIMLTNQKIATAEVRPVGCTLKKKG